MITSADVDTIPPYNPRSSYSYQQTLTERPNFGVDGGRGMNERIVKVETLTDVHGKIIEDIRSDLKNIRADIQNSEKRVIDKMDENQKWLVSLIISSILIPLLIALLTK